MAKPATKTAPLEDESVLEGPAPKTVKVTYCPIENGDPHTTTVGGVAFRANVPVNIAADRPVLALLRKEKEQEDGALRTQGIETKVRLIDLLKNNPWFEVEGFPRATRRRASSSAGPNNAAEYRGYVLRWIAAAKTSEQLEARWKDEEDMRTRCGISDADVDGIMCFYEAQMAMVS